MQEKNAGKHIFKSLKSARNKKGWNKDYVATQLHLSPSCIESLEQAFFEKFPNGPYATGYLRNYCDLLDIDPQPLLAAYERDTPSQPCLAFYAPAMQKMKLSSGYEHRKYKTFYGVVCAFMLFALVGVLSSNTLMKQSKPLSIDIENTDIKNNANGIQVSRVMIQRAESINTESSDLLAKNQSVDLYRLGVE